MSGQDDPYSGVPQGWSHDEKGQPMIVVQAPPSGDLPPAVSRRSAALMWMGALLGGTFIAAIFLAFVYIDASNDVRDLRRDLNTERTALTTTKANLSAMTERAKMYDDDNRDLLRENNELRTRLRMPERPRPAPRQSNPFAEDTP